MKTYPNQKNPNSSPSERKTKTKDEKEKPSFFDTVYKLVRKIPRGRATTYGAIAECAGIRLSARMVGWAMNGAGHLKPPVPAHRVVNRNGMLSGKHHFDTPTLMQELLESEGIKVKDDIIQDFQNVFWDPAGNKKKPTTSAVKKSKKA